MSEYTLYIVTALLVAVSVATSQLAFGPDDDVVRIEQASYGAGNPAIVRD